MNYKTAAVVAALLFLLTVIVAKTLIPGPARIVVIPLPKKVLSRGGLFNLSQTTVIMADGLARETGNYLAERLRKSTGYPLNIISDQTAIPGSITLKLQDSTAGADPESYQLRVSPDAVRVTASGPAGLFYGVQSLLELLPAEVLASKPERSKQWRIPSLEIQDQPRFKWRGLLLDVARHFFTKDEIKVILDAMGLHKLNTLQLHLTDDQGWRVEIKKYPRLTEVGAWRKSIGFHLDPKASTTYGPDGRYGGYYTQADIRELVAYARARHITILPEIEMPGHASAALSAYPEFSCNGGPYSTEMGEGVFAGVCCAGKDETFEFLGSVLEEISGLFPGKYIHIGGDEVSKDNWKACSRCQARLKQEGLKNPEELQSYFIRRIEKWLNNHGRTLIGWSEIREGGLAQNAVVMDWIGGGTEAATAGHDVVMTPTGYCYLDYYQSTNHESEPSAIGGYLPLKKVYSFEPVPEGLAPQYQRHIVGAQGNLWTEYIPNLKHAEYMMFPRLSALAEVTWSPQGLRSYDDFARRLTVQFRRFDMLGLNYRKGFSD